MGQNCPGFINSRQSSIIDDKPILYKPAEFICEMGHEFQFEMRTVERYCELCSEMIRLGGYKCKKCTYEVCTRCKVKPPEFLNLGKDDHRLLDAELKDMNAEDKDKDANVWTEDIQKMEPKQQRFMQDMLLTHRYPWNYVEYETKDEKHAPATKKDEPAPSAPDYQRIYPTMPPDYQSIQSTMPAYTDEGNKECTQI